MSKKSQLEKNLTIPELTGHLLKATEAAASYFREILWKSDLQFDGISTLKAATKMLEDAIRKIVPNEQNEDDKSQLKLEI